MAEKKLIPQKIKVLFTIVNAGKGDYYRDIIDDFGVNLQLNFAGNGTVPQDSANLWGFAVKNKDVLISIVQEERVKRIINELDKKFETKDDVNGIAFAVPINSVIGVSAYQFLANERSRRK